jgi:hypothetical protein
MGELHRHSKNMHIFAITTHLLPLPSAFPAALRQSKAMREAQMDGAAVWLMATAGVSHERVNSM